MAFAIEIEQSLSKGLQATHASGLCMTLTARILGVLILGVEELQLSPVSHDLSEMMT